MENRVNYGTLDLQHIFGNLQAPDLSGGSKSKDAKLVGNDTPDFSLAYLGPQIWQSAGISDDFKLEQINLDELLDETALNEGLSDISALMNDATEDGQKKQDKTSDVAEGPIRSLQEVTGFDQFCNNAAGFSIPMPTVEITALPQNKELSSPKTNETTAQESFNFEPNITDMMISTPLEDDDDTTELFDPRKRSFTDDELRPQPIIRKARKVYVPTESKDAKYWHKREKNNAAAKRSREARRIKENQIVMRTKFLEKENDGLRNEVTDLRAEVSKLMKVIEGYQEKEKK